MNERNGNDLCTIIAQAISEMEAEQGKSLSIDEINLADLERRTGITRARLRRLKNNNFKPMPHGRTGQHAEITVLSGFTGACIWRRPPAGFAEQNVRDAERAATCKQPFSF